MWKIGDRVLAQRRPGIYWYPGTIRHIDGERFYVIYDDGEDAFVANDHLTKCRFEIGDQVFVHNHTVDDFLQGRVQEIGNKKLRVEYNNGNEQWVEMNSVRVHPETWKKPVIEDHAAAPAWSVCDRVLACWYDLDWYPGIVLAVEPDRIHVLFDDGDQALVRPEKVRPLRLTQNEEVLCRRHGGPEYHAGKISEIDDEKITVRYDDGDEETTSVRLIRLHRDEWFPSKSAVPLSVGERVLAQWYDMFWYPGVILSLDGRRVHIAYEHGNLAMATPEQVRPMDVGVGSQVFCRSQDSPEFRPCQVTKRNGEMIYVQYENGQGEWTSFRMVRLEC